MTTGTLAEALLEEAEAIVWAEWIRLQRERQLAEACAAMPAARPLPPQVGVLTATFHWPGALPPGGSRQRPARRRQDRRFWPTERSPPKHHRPQAMNTSGR